jgi:hypothetical protein
LNLDTLSSNTSNASAVSAAVTSSLNSLSSNASALASAQTSILTSLTTGLNNSAGSLTNLSSSNAAAAASVVLAVVSAAPNVTLTAESQSAALSVLTAVAAAPINVSGAAGVAVVSALSAIAASASNNNPAALTQVTGVLDSLATNAASSLLSSIVSGGSGGSSAPATVTFSTPSIQAAISVTPPGVVSTTPISAPGSASSFNPLPPGLLSSAAGGNSSAAIITQFRSLSFDPWANVTAGTNLSTVGGSTRLAFSTASGPLEVSNASTPVTFTLPGVATGGSNLQATCSFYNTTSRAYSTSGCIGVPNPAPANHTLAFRPNVTVPDDASLVLAWTIQGPMNEPGLCSELVLNCGSNGPCEGPIWGKSCVVYPNPRSPLSGNVSCPQNLTALGLSTPPVLRVIYGAGCALWQPNVFNCSWDNTKQAFTGTGCVSPSNVTHCMCRHLTDFAAARAPKVTTCSFSDMTSFSAADIIKKLKTLFEMVVIMFGLMHVGALVGVMQDRAHNAKVIRHVTSPGMGFQLSPTGAWMWHLQQQPLQGDVGTPEGSAVALAGVLGFPFIRLRVALPEEYLPGSAAEAIGRKHGLSVAGLQGTQSQTDAALEAVRAALPLCLGGGIRRRKIPDVLAEPNSMHGPGEGAIILLPPPRVDLILQVSRLPMSQLMYLPQPDDALDQRPVFVAAELFDYAPAEALPFPRREDCLVSTALLFAHMANARCLPIVDFCNIRALTGEYFRGTTVRGHSFEDLCGKFMLMLGDDDGSLVVRSKWMKTSRMWRLILLQNPDGSFDVSDSLAFALEAHAGPLPPRQSSTEATASGVLSKFRMLLSPPDDLDELVDGEEEANERVNDNDLASARGIPVNAMDDPLTFAAATVVRAMPKRMERYIKPVDVRQRVWATLLALVWLEESDSSWLLDKEGTITIVDACHSYLNAIAAHHRRLGRHKLRHLHREAGLTLRRWRAATQYAMQQARNSDGLARQNAMVRMQNAVSRIVKSMMTDHDTFSTFLDPDGFIQRWQRFMILMTLLASSLLTSIWFYSSRGIACCTEIRTLLNTGAGQTCGMLATSTSDYASNLPMSQYLLSSSSNSSAAALPGTCPPPLSAAPCLGSVADCGDLPTQFPGLQGAFTYSPTVQCSSSPGDPSCTCRTTLDDYVCHAFPDDAYFTDQIFVGLICVAVALPVTMFLERCFEIANEVEGAAEGWVIWAGVWRLVLGKHVHKDWRWADADDPPSDFVQLLATGPGWREVANFAFCKVLHLTSAKGSDGEGSAKAEIDRAHRLSQSDAASSSGQKSEGGDAQRAAVVRQMYAAAGLLGVYVTWAIFSWFIFTYGMIIYRRLGPEAERQFVKTWGVGIGLDQAQQWQDVAKEALKAAALIVVLDMFRVTTHRAWFEDFCDFASCQALLFKGTAHSLWGQISVLIRHQSRVQAG